MKLTKKQFLVEVREEIDHIKKNATSTEINKLDLTNFDPHFPKTCIYGQMTGLCTSERAFELAPKKYGDLSRSDYSSEKLRGLQTFTDVLSNDHFFDDPLFTPLEVYITLKDAKWTNVIGYLKGEKPELKL